VIVQTVIMYVAVSCAVICIVVSIVLVQGYQQEVKKLVQAEAKYKRAITICAHMMKRHVADLMDELELRMESSSSDLEV
jgi:hypothetical protein